MPLETATYINDLVVTNPANSDGLNQADDHMRLIKAAVKNTFPNFTSAALTSTQADIDSAVIAANAVNARNGSVPAGAIVDFGMAAAPTGWLICDGQAVSRTTYAALFTAIGTTWGAGDGSTTFAVPGLTSRFRRHREVGGLAGAVGTLQSPTNLAHTHGVSGTTTGRSADHSHTYSGTTGGMNANNPHTHGVSGGIYGGSGAYFNFGNFDGLSGPIGVTAITIGATDINHGHTFSGTTSGENVDHTHSFSATSTGGSADNASESRPYSATVLTCIKT